MQLRNQLPLETKAIIYNEITKEENFKRISKDSHDNLVPIAISARHIHLNHSDLETLFGQGYELNKIKPLSQPGQFAANETVTLVGPKDVIQDVRILGPVRAETQVEIAETDGYHLGLTPPVRLSGNIEGTPGITLVGPNGAVTLKKGVILAATHIHMTPQDAHKLDIKNGDYLQVEIDGQRDIILTNVVARVDDNFNLEMHIDTDEANAAVIARGDRAKIIAIGREN